MYAIVKSGGHQYKAVVGENIDVEKLPYSEGTSIELEEVLLIAREEGSPVIGKPHIAGAKVKATIVSQFRGPKILVWKYIPKERYRRRQGHRQSYTRLRIDAIEMA